ncbi:MAG TPA: thiamine pyrophosphate-dependent dehydrogenase E1 component subunit alpha [Thermoanaerobaculia bacterium]|nr:thiamine pyrophosphate-dependent dehydrogenase E1 component subunit alpha [Thermoanaerobaculia bacterium]
MTSLSYERQKELYRYMVLNRAVEERLVNLYRQGKVVGGLYRSLGQEATSVGTAYALDPGDILAPLIRNLGSTLVRGVSARDVITQYMARATAPSGGKDCNLHFSAPEKGIYSPISMLGTLIPVVTGMLLGERLKGARTVGMTYIGDGGTSVGAFHEGLNFAAVQKLPLVLVIEFNHWAYSTPYEKQCAARTLADKAVGYGIPGEVVDGNDVFAVYEVTRRAVERARAGAGPTLVECKTYRMKGHAEHDGQAYVEKSEIEEWKSRDPIARCERVLAESGVMSAAEREEIHASIYSMVDADVAFAEASPFPDPDLAFKGVYADDAIVTRGRAGVFTGGL